MNTNDLLLKCCALIEQKLSWGSSDNWQNQDFEALSAQIFDQTQVVLSVSTLKRVWGKVKYDSLPSPTTLNTLAVFAGYKNWREFRQQQIAAEGASTGSTEAGPATMAGAAQAEAAAKNRTAGTVPDTAPGAGHARAATPAAHLPSPGAPNQQSGSKAPRHSKSTSRRNRLTWYLIPAILAILVLAGWMYKKSASTVPGEYTFSSQPLASGIPNSVIFNYNADAAGSDSVFIQQSWDPRRRFPVPHNGRTYTSMYYYPGFFKAKLVVGDKIVKEHDLMIPSNGWLAAVDQQPVPVYFSTAETTGSGALRIPVPLMESRNIALQPKVPEVRYYYVGDMQGLQNDNFILETELKSDYSQGSAVCQLATVLVLCENTAFMIPLGIPGCVAEMGLMLADKGFNAQNANLSGFGCNMNEWVRLRCEVRNKQVQIWVNDKKAYEYTFKEVPNKIVGVSYRFQGPGSVNGIKLTRTNGSAVLEDTFE